MSAGLRVAVFPQPAHFNNPYQPLLHAALEREGATILPGREPGPLWAWRAGGGVDVAHLHWIEPIVRPYPPHRGAAAVAAFRAARLEAALRMLRRVGARIVWTVHNIRPHEQRYPGPERRAMEAVLAAADSLITHSRHAEERVRAELGWRGEVHAIPHGHYIGVYPPERRSRAEVRRELGLPGDAFVFLAFGKVRAYKQLPEAIAAVRATGDAHLVVAGAPHPEVGDGLREAAAGNERIHLHLHDISDDEVGAYHLAADAALLNYRDVFSSGALLLALSLGLPVVAPSPSTATEVAGPPAIAPFTGNDLGSALAAVREGDPEDRRRAAVAAAEACSWERVAALTLAAYGVR